MLHWVKSIMAIIIGNSAEIEMQIFVRNSGLGEAPNGFQQRLQNKKRYNFILLLLGLHHKGSMKTTF